MNCIDVVAGIVFNEARSKVLLALRKPDQDQGNLWEFPGGKQESGEALKKALKRELLEEIGIVVKKATPRTIIEHQYSEKQVRLHFWDVSAFAGVPEGREGQVLKWVALSELASLRFPEANLPVVEELSKSSNLNKSGK